ncbi:DUF2125 domain-containing protein [Pseudoruegeria sp. HB172150]|uniref:DUF2125 domain-containing protein n=1 Tax=Pseudoruegeria sp. HB172150 TaxID=2721164 RepID=UPI001551B7E1|nr:DUF2125 domain-containing protein [Pseudoruegeria sp. HB172150]
MIFAAGTAAQADVTSTEVWEAWQSAAEAMGQTLTPGSVDEDGGTLTLTDLQVSMETTDVSVSGTIPEVVFTEQGDGTVSIGFSPSYDMQIDVEPESGEQAEITMNFAFDGLDMVASGTPDAVTYEYDIAEMDMTVAQLVVDGEEVTLDALIKVSGLSGTYVTSGDDSATMTSTFAAEAMDITFHMDEPDGGDGVIDGSINLTALSAESEGSMSLFGGGFKELPEMLNAGMASATSFTHGPSNYTFDFKDDEESMSVTGSAEGGQIEIGLSADELLYNVSNTGVDMTMSGSEIPLPEVAFSAGEFGFNMQMPVSKSEEPKDVAFGITMADLSVSEMIWGIIDPSGQLPHDPATLIIDISGKASPLFDMFDPEAAMEMEDEEMPVSLESMDLNKLQLTLAGAELTGEGGFTFDMDNLETFDGMPAPTGKISLQLVGANALLDKLVSMGLVPEDQAMGARMMMGLFARPGDGDDTLVSEIEVDGATGAVSANGQRLQ